MATIDDLRHELSNEVTAVPASPERLAQVHQRITRHRRRRTAGAGLAATALLLVAAAVFPGFDHRADRTEPAEPTPSPSVEGPLPEYHAGGVRLAEAIHDGSGPFTVPFTPSSQKLMFTVDCYVPGVQLDDPAPPMVQLRVNGSSMGLVSCSGSSRLNGVPADTYTPDPATLTAINPGRIAQLLVSIDQSVPAGSRIRVGIYQSVPFDEYPFPPTPTPLPSLELYGNVQPGQHAHPLRLITPDENLPVPASVTTYVQPNGLSTYDLTVERGLTIEGQTVAPGSITLKVGDRVVYATSSWDYGQSGFGATVTLDELGISPGDTVTVTVVAERFPGDSWALLLSDES